MHPIWKPPLESIISTTFYTLYLVFSLISISNEFLCKAEEICKTIYEYKPNASIGQDITQVYHSHLLPFLFSYVIISLGCSGLSYFPSLVYLQIINTAYSYQISMELPFSKDSWSDFFWKQHHY